ncbi:MAG: CBS domain-containing protein [SAR324 cluster bacterium]|nr:CBS domain-containing protein [SAR324 cluster bacterium]
MKSEVYSLYADQTIELADAWMKKYGIRHLPVVDTGKRVIGVMSRSDLDKLRVFAQLKTNEISKFANNTNCVCDFMKQDVITVSPECSVEEAAQILWENKFGCLPVESNGKLIGIVTQSDFLKLIFSSCLNTTPIYHVA